MLPDAVLQKGERLEGVNACTLVRARRSASTTIVTTQLTLQTKIVVLLRKRNARGITTVSSQR